MSSKHISKTNVAVSDGGGKVGNVRIYKKGDNTYLRAANSRSSNPRTINQMKGRIKWNNIINTWNFLKPALRELYEDATASVSAYNLFTKRSAHTLPVYLPKDLAKTRCCVAAPYALSQGSLPPIDYKKDAPETLVSDIRLGEGFTITEDTTVGQLSTAIHKSNSRFNWNDEIMFVAVEQRSLSNGMPTICVATPTLLLDSTDQNKVWTRIGATGFSAANGHLSTSKALQPGCYGWIHIRRKDGKTYVSTQDLYNFNEETLDYYSSEEAFNQARPTYGKAKPRPFSAGEEQFDND